MNKTIVTAIQQIYASKPKQCEKKTILKDFHFNCHLLFLSNKIHDTVRNNSIELILISIFHILLLPTCEMWTIGIHTSPHIMACALAD